jgi:ribosomal protein S18 acetylase RimI-like enzyme
MIRYMKIDDVNQVVAVHLFSFQGFFLTFLGPRFLSIFYSGICSTPKAIAFVYLNDAGIPAGFVAGTSNPCGFFSRLLKRYWLKFALASMTPILRKPSIIKRVARAVFHPSGNPVGDDIAGLFSIGVLPELQGTGVGKELVRSFLYEAKQRGCKRVFLTTDRDNNDVINNFYAKLGFTIDRQYVTPEGRRMNELWITLSEVVT